MKIPPCIQSRSCRSIPQGCQHPCAPISSPHWEGEEEKELNEKEELKKLELYSADCANVSNQLRPGRFRGWHRRQSQGRERETAASIHEPGLVWSAEEEKELKELKEKEELKKLMGREEHGNEEKLELYSADCANVSNQLRSGRFCGWHRRQERKTSFHEPGLVWSAASFHEPAKKLFLQFPTKQRSISPLGWPSVGALDLLDLLDLHPAQQMSQVGNCDRWGMRASRGKKPQRWFGARRSFFWWRIFRLCDLSHFSPN